MANQGQSASKAWLMAGDDDANQAVITRAIYCTVAGDIKVIFADDTDAVTLPVEANKDYPWMIKKLFATATTATIYGLR
jgi:hypothetical protein